jgi:intracellular multiplication protein IcmJ
MTELQPFQNNILELRASPDSWRLFSARKSDPNFHPFEKKVFERDAYTCHFCGFQAKEFQEIVNLDGNFRNNKISNLVTACVFCTQCFFLESIGVGGFGGGILIYMPEFSQAEINSICHVLFCAITNNSAYKNTAQNIYLNLKLRSAMVDAKFGEGASEPANFGHLLIDASHVGEEILKKMTEGLRILPSRARFRTQIEAWASSAILDINS